MPAPLLTTKLNVPQVRPQQVTRPRLLARLDEGLRLGRRMTLLSAPAGYGKTTLLAEWIATHRAVASARDVDSHQVERHARSDPPATRHSSLPTLQFAWLSLDEQDSDLGRFLTYLAAALQRIDERIGVGIQSALRTTQPRAQPVDTLLTTLINELDSAAVRLVLVLDDYHTITDQAVHAAVAFLLAQQPPNAHLVLSTRHDPPFSFAQLRARAQVTEIRQRDLQFTVEEAATFLNGQMELRIASADVTALRERTEGWISGLQLAALSIRGRDASEIEHFVATFSGRHHFVLDYVTDQVLERQPAPFQRFLLETSILERMCGALCDALVTPGSGQVPVPSDPAAAPSVLQSGQQVLEHLERANLFVVPLDDEREWYRYHCLFAELLRARLRERAPDREPILHSKAATWYHEHGLSAEAIRHALAGNDLEQAADILEGSAREASTWSSVEISTFLGWLEQLPQEILRDRPWLWLLSSRVYYLAGQQETTERFLQEMELALEADPSLPDAAMLRGLIVADRASYAAVRGDVQEAIALADRAEMHFPKGRPGVQIRIASIRGLAHLRAGNVVEAGQAFSSAIAAACAAGMPYAATPLACNLAEVQLLQGQLAQAERSCQQALEFGTVDGKLTSTAGFAEIELARILYERNELQEAEACAREGLALLEHSGTPHSFGTGHVALACALQALGDPDGALSASQDAVQAAHSCNIPRLMRLMSAHRARIWLAQGSLDLATQWAQEYGTAGETPDLSEFEDLTLARVWLVTGQVTEARSLLDALLPPASDAGRIGRVIEILALMALAYWGLGDRTRATETLRQSLQPAVAEGHVRTFLDMGKPMAELLLETVRQSPTDPTAAYAGHLLGAFAQPPDVHAGRQDAHAQPGGLIEPLTSRELEVLHLLAERLSNAEIAQRLVISLPTVKSHTRSIYGKLGVHSRKQAVAQAKALGILPPA